MGKMRLLKTRTLGKLFGVEVKLHGTFVLLPLFLGLSGFLRGGAAEGLLSLLLVGLVFMVVVAHEYGHIFAARFYGLGTRDIVLTPIGGLARIQGVPRKPAQEVVIALAGPAVNLVLAGLTYGGIRALPYLGSAPESALPLAALFLNWFLTMNLLLCLFNLLPALPMDGGRVLRAGLTPRYGAVKATRIAARLARWLALAMAIYGVASGQWTLVFIAGFVVVTSSLELFQAQARSFLSGGGVGGPSSGGARWSPGGVGQGVVVDQDGRPVGSPTGSFAEVRRIRWADPGDPGP